MIAELEIIIGHWTIPYILSDHICSWVDIKPYLTDKVFVCLQPQITVLSG